MTLLESLAQNEVLENEVSDLREKTTQLQEKRVHLESENSRLREIIKELKRWKFGKSSERWESQEQLVFNEIEVEAKKSEPEESVEVKAHTKKRGHRRKLPEDLPREVVVIELPKEQQFSEEGLPLKPIGKEVSEKLSYEPSKIKVIEYHRIKYGVDFGDYEKTASPVPSIIPKGICTPELLSSIVTQKFADGLPLYRQEEIFKRHSIELYRSTMARWVVEASVACGAVLNVLNDRLMSSFYVSCDETSTQVLKEKGRKAESKSWMWVRGTPYGENRIVIFEYDPHRTGEVAKRLFTEFKGILQVDGLSVYNAVNRDIIEIGCRVDEGVTPPRPSQTRTCSFPASGSSIYGLAA